MSAEVFVEVKNKDAIRKLFPEKCANASRPFGVEKLKCQIV